MFLIIGTTKKVRLFNLLVTSQPPLKHSHSLIKGYVITRLWMLKSIGHLNGSLPLFPRIYLLVFIRNQVHLLSVFLRTWATDDERMSLNVGKMKKSSKHGSPLNVYKMLSLIHVWDEFVVGFPGFCCCVCDISIFPHSSLKQTNV